MKVKIGHDRIMRNGPTNSFFVGLLTLYQRDAN